MPFFHSNIRTHTRTCVHSKVFAAYHVFTDQLTLAGDRKPATKTETWGSQQRNQDCILRAGNGKFRTLHIPVHLASRSTFKNENMARKFACGQSERSWRRIRIYASNLSVSCTCCCFRLRPELTHRNEQRGSLCFETAAVHICVLHRYLLLRLTEIKYGINLQAPCVLYIETGVSLHSRERFLYIYSTNIFHYLIFSWRCIIDINNIDNQLDATITTY